MHLSPCKERGSRNWVPGHGGGAAPPIPVRPAAFPAWRGRGEECMLTKGPLTLRTWSGRHSTTVHGGDQRGQPRRPRFRRDRRTEWTTRDARGTRGSMDGAQTIRWLGTSRTIARRRRRSWRVVQRGWVARPGAHKGGQPP
jgi:hypothetical protein